MYSAKLQVLFDNSAQWQDKPKLALLTYKSPSSMTTPNGNGWQSVN